MYPDQEGKNKIASFSHTQMHDHQLKKKKRPVKSAKMLLELISIVICKFNIKMNYIPFTNNDHKWKLKLTVTLIIASSIGN